MTGVQTCALPISSHYTPLPHTTPPSLTLHPPPSHYPRSAVFVITARACVREGGGGGPLTGTLPVAAAGLLDSDRRQVVPADWGLQPVTVHLVALDRDRSAGVAPHRVAAVLQQPRLARLNTHTHTHTCTHTAANVSAVVVGLALDRKSTRLNSSH